jgi:hypothetical protein
MHVIKRATNEDTNGLPGSGHGIRNVEEMCIKGIGFFDISFNGLSISGFFYAENREGISNKSFDKMAPSN